ncbi:hypothetical protein EJV47_17960 [Hymenobacter gummosus]|uniref:Lipoprotein n=1 Tax=Hymenobacter gummosus TaxID=1776032 RepID=A0A3S0HLH3_9BACT|nr:hypothetical protein [Hymenobacter gummosus]RTQ47807.1 hypothetical protein EJV47_17960 [Hymenobacter gummosus]
MKLCVLAFPLASLLLAGCNKSQTVTASAREWLRQSDGERLTFRADGMGAIETLVVTQKNSESTSSRGRGFGTITHHNITLTFQSQTDADAGLVTGFSSANVLFSPLRPGSPDGVGLSTDTEQLYNNSGSINRATHSLTKDTLINGRTHSRVVRGTFSAQAVVSVLPNTLQTFWYAKDAGLVAYRKVTGPIYYRVF